MCRQYPAHDIDVLYCILYNRLAWHVVPSVPAIGACSLVVAESVAFVGVNPAPCCAAQAAASHSWAVDRVEVFVTPSLRRRQALVVQFCTRTREFTRFFCVFVRCLPPLRLFRQKQHLVGCVMVACANCFGHGWVCRAPRSRAVCVTVALSLVQTAGPGTVSSTVVVPLYMSAKHPFSCCRGSAITLVPPCCPSSPVGTINRARCILLNGRERGDWSDGHGRCFRSRRYDETPGGVYGLIFQCKHNLVRRVFQRPEGGYRVRDVYGDINETKL